MVELEAQVGFLRKSCKAYDEGDYPEAKRIALCLRILLHDHGQSRSLLRQLGKGFSWKIADTADRDPPGNLLTHHGLLAVKLSAGPTGTGFSYDPKFVMWDSQPSGGPLWPFTPFYTWWRETVVIRDQAGHRFTRADIVLAVANTDGGAHVDPELDEAYAALIQDGTLGWMKDEGVRVLDDPVAPSLRSIGYEILKTIDAADLLPSRTT
jgi:hypothetical protein